MYIRGNNFARVYRILLNEIMKYPDNECKPRDQLIKEKNNIYFEIKNPYQCLFFNDVRSSQWDYIQKEIEWYLSGEKDPKFISQFASLWNRIKNPDGTVNSNYGYLTLFEKNEYGFTQFEWALKSLVKDKDSRQAIIHFNNSSHQFDRVKDFPCTLYGIFNIRNNELNFTIHMRSQDAIYGLPNDIVFFYILQELMLYNLIYYYPINLRMGKYCHFVNSLHIYERHFDLVNNMLENEFKPNKKEIIQNFDKVFRLWD